MSKETTELLETMKRQNIKIPAFDINKVLIYLESYISILEDENHELREDLIDVCNIAVEARIPVQAKSLVRETQEKYFGFGI